MSIKVAGIHFRYPNLLGDRIAEGGKRLSGISRESRQDLPLVTIITVCFNSAKTIEQTIDSVRNQTYRNIEYIVIDGASSDGTLKIIDNNKDAIDYYLSEPDQGIYDAMNKGIMLAKGDYILLLNSDDWYENNAVEELVAARRYSGCDIVCSLARVVDQDSQFQNIMRSMPYDASCYLRMPLRHETMLIAAKIYNQIGNYDTTYPISADYEFTIRLFKAGYTVYEVNQALLFFRDTGVSNVNDKGILKDRYAIIKKYFTYLEDVQIKLLINRDTHSGEDLLDLTDNNQQDPIIRDAIHCYVQSQARNGILGKGRPKWIEQGNINLQHLQKSRSNNKIKISVVLAVYNAQNSLSKCLDSILAQTFADFELICVNDCSPDNSQLILDEYAATDARIRPVKNEINIGCGATRNQGVKMAKGNYIFHVDPDDTIPPKALEVLYEAAITYGSDLVRGAYLREQFHAGADYFEPKVMFPLKDKRMIVNAKAADIPELVKMPEGHWAFLYETNFARRVPYPEDLKMGQDCAFLIPALSAAESITVIPDVVYNYLANPESAMNIFKFQKYLDVLEWRRRGFHVLKGTELGDVGLGFLRIFPNTGWNKKFITSFQQNPKIEQLEALGNALRKAYNEAMIAEINPKAPAQHRGFLTSLLNGDTQRAYEQIMSASFASIPKNTPTISVILPIYNAEKTLRRSIDSALKQSLKSIEVVCINDCSPDSSQAIIDEYASNDKRIIPILNQKNIGHGASRNVGIKAARGKYIFHLDPDDELIPDSLEKILEYAERYGSDMVRGAYIHEQLLLGETKTQVQRKGLGEGKNHIVNTSLQKTPNYLNNTEGHWSYLYRADFAKKVKYPEDLKMGQDSIFMVNAVLKAKAISVTDVLVYHYRANPNSAMNTFNFRKFMDALEWRIRAWNALCERGFNKAGEHLLFRFWSPLFFKNLEKLPPDEKLTFERKLGSALSIAGYPGSGSPKVVEVKEFLDRVFQKNLTNLKPSSVKPLRVATLSTQDHGGAGIGSMRRIAALRQNGIQASMYTLFRNSCESFVQNIQPKKKITGNYTWKDMRRDWRSFAVLDRVAYPGLKSRELFSKVGSIVDFRQNQAVFNNSDIVHLHWVVGMFDYENSSVLAHKPVVWTLADMNAFTGGCHYSEGCTNYEDNCKDCHLLAKDSQIAHEAWKIKNEAYSKIPNLNIVCPSQWLADRAKRSSLFRNRPVHVIPNPAPIGQFAMTAKSIARLKLGLDPSKLYIAFGADSLSNLRKGGDIFIKALKLLSIKDNVSVIMFGSSELDVPLPSVNLGKLDDPEKVGLAYSASDVYAFPSREDNAPLTVMESLLCGTPVVGFNVGNVPDLIDTGVNGYIATNYSPQSFADGLEMFLQKACGSEVDRAASLRTSVKCRSSVLRHNDPSLSALIHTRLYQDLVDNVSSS